MNKLLATSLGLVVCGLMVTPAFAGHWHHACAPACAPVCCAPAPQPCVTWVEKQVTCYKTEVRVREVSCTVTRVVPRTVVENQQVTVCVPVWTEQKRVCTVYRQVPHVVEREVTCCKMVRECCTDPCTGCTYTVCRPVTYVQKVHCTVYECVPSQQEYTVKVCSVHNETRTVQVNRVVCETKQETVVNKVPYCVQVPYVTTVKVPVCTYVAPTCGGCCP